jgi:hemin uptake protein HemP
MSDMPEAHTAAGPQQVSSSSGDVAADYGQPLSSEALLQGRRIVEIRHNGEVYRLQATRLGKLILTK